MFDFHTYGKWSSSFCKIYDKMEDAMKYELKHKLVKNGIFTHMGNDLRVSPEFMTRWRMQWSMNTSLKHRLVKNEIYDHVNRTIVLIEL